MLDANLVSQLKAYLEHITQPIEIVAYLDDSAKAHELRELLEQIVAQSEKIQYREAHDANKRTPSFSIQRVGTDICVEFAGIPLGHEFASLVLALIQVGGHPVKVDDTTRQRIENLQGDFLFEVYYSLSCQNCPDVVQALNAMAVINPRIRPVAIDGALNQDEVKERQVMSVPAVYLNGEVFHHGRASIEELLAKLDAGDDEAQAQAINEREPYEVLIVGGGPAGAAAAVYAARKGIRTGVVAERFGGQVLDTMSIENYISVLETEGPQFATALEEHVKAYDVDIMNLQRAQSLSTEGKQIHIKLDHGGVLKANSVILATGARWRELGVPGEAEYRNRGVAYCPHCDGPLYKGKNVAVIGGGNSGVEAAIDLAGLVKHVTVIEYGDQLRADEVLQRKLRSLPNVNIITQAQTTEIVGDDSKVVGLRYTDRASQESHTIPLEGVFIQIGLVPNTEWLNDSIKLSKYGEIEIDNRGQTSIPGVFAAGDATTVPYKQIVIAAGQGACAALSAFDYLIRSSVES